MQLGIRLVVVGAVILAAAGIALFMVNSEANDFRNFTESNRGDAQCEIKHSEWENSLNSTSGSLEETDEAEEISDEWEDECSEQDWSTD